MVKCEICVFYYKETVISHLTKNGLSARFVFFYYKEAEISHLTKNGLSARFVFFIINREKFSS